MIQDCSVKCGSLAELGQTWGGQNADVALAEPVWQGPAAEFPSALTILALSYLMFICGMDWNMS